jgi:hypothetical protein
LFSPVLLFVIRTLSEAEGEECAVAFALSLFPRLR